MYPNVHGELTSQKQEERWQLGNDWWQTLNLPISLSSSAAFCSTSASSEHFPRYRLKVWSQSSKVPNSCSSSLLYTCRGNKNSHTLLHPPTYVGLAWESISKKNQFQGVGNQELIPKAGIHSIKGNRLLFKSLFQLYRAHHYSASHLLIMIGSPIHFCEQVLLDDLFQWTGSNLKKTNLINSKI